MNRIIERLSSFGVVPVVALDHSCTAASVAKALIAGGLPCAEITFRTAAAEESIHLIKAAYPDMLIGAGTVTTTGQVDQAINAGAEFIVSPGIDRKLIDYCVKKQIAVIPGCVTPSELMEAVSRAVWWGGDNYGAFCSFSADDVYPDRWDQYQQYRRLPISPKGNRMWWQLDG